MEPNKDEMFQALADETDSKTAETFFGYILYEYHFQPDELEDVYPEFFEKLSDYLENNEWTTESLRKFTDDQFINYYNTIARRY